jgi:recombination protein RecA
VVFINQIRMKIGVMFGNPETTTGGNALKFYASVRMDVRKIASIKQSEEEVVGSRTRVKVVKNKMAAPFKQAEFDIMFGKGISRSGDVLDLAVAKDIVAKSGSWFSYKDERIGQGRENAKEFIETHPDMMKRIEAEVLKVYGVSRGGKEDAAAADANNAKAGATAAAKAPVAPVAKAPAVAAATKK